MDRRVLLKTKIIQTMVDSRHWYLNANQPISEVTPLQKISRRNIQIRQETVVENGKVNVRTRYEKLHFTEFSLQLA